VPSPFHPLLLPVGPPTSGTNVPLFMACPESTVRSTTLTTDRVLRWNSPTVPASKAVSAPAGATDGVTSAGA
jgi:hypothetical protein